MAKGLHTGARSKLKSSHLIALGALNDDLPINLFESLGIEQESKTDEELVSHLDGGKSQLMVPRLDMFKLQDQSQGTSIQALHDLKTAQQSLLVNDTDGTHGEGSVPMMEYEEEITPIVPSNLKIISRLRSQDGVGTIQNM